MSLSKIHLVMLFLSIAYLSGVSSGSVGNDKDIACEKRLQQHVRELARSHFGDSVSNLYAGIAISNQVVERHGLAKYLRELSNSHWETGMATVQKYIKRGGLASDGLHENTIRMTVPQDQFGIFVQNGPTQTFYLDILRSLQTQSRSIINLLNEIHSDATQSTCSDFHDADWGHFAEERLESEIEHERELDGNIKTLARMESAHLALDFFDSHY